MVTNLYSFKQEVHINHIGLAIVVLILPFALFLHLYFSSDITILTILNFEIDHGFNNNRGWAWNFLSLLIPLVLMIIWFITSFDWWRYFILFPVFLYITRIALRIFRYPDLIEMNLAVFSLVVALVLVLLIVFIDSILFANFRERGFMIVRLNLFDNEIRRFYYWLKSKVIFMENELSYEEKNRYMKNLFLTKSVVESEIDKFSNFDSSNFIRKKKWDYAIVSLLLISCTFFLPIH